MLFQTATSGGSCNCSRLCSNFSHCYQLHAQSPVTFPAYSCFLYHLPPSCAAALLVKQGRSLREPGNLLSHSGKTRNHSSVSVLQVFLPLFCPVSTLPVICPLRAFTTCESDFDNLLDNFLQVTNDDIKVLKDLFLFFLFSAHYV